ncbi:ankyrin-2-like [Artemia franciscana]|uniref:SOCS box domain-containing protein n=1 Tax=Artemia franciscana TaxID=6661 RepID=A0AA88H258_ARTSF|nr:hypothetical protein QYM36_018575 [Artemia franciscana]
MVSKTRVKKRRINFTYLHKAAKDGSVSICKRLIQAGTPIDIFDRKNKTALHIAIINGHYDVVKHLLDNGANSNSHFFSFGFWWTPLQIAAKIGDIGICELLIKAGAQINSVRKIDGATALWIAKACCISIDCDNVVKYLLENGASPNVRTSCGGYFTTPLHIAALTGDIDGCELLIKAGAEIDPVCNVDSATSRSIEHCTKYVRYFWKYVRNKTPLQIAAIRCNIGICELLVQAGAQINGADGCDESPLLSIIELRPKSQSRRNYYLFYFLLVEYLLKNGANANYKSRDGRKPLHQAVLHNLPKVCQLLVSFGADVDDTYTIGEYWQKSPLVMAFHFKRYNIIKYLFNKSAKFNVEQAENFLYIADKAVQKQDIEMLQFLIRCENSPLDREWICKKIRNTILKDRTHKKLQFFLFLSNIHPTFGETYSGLTDMCRNDIRKNLDSIGICDLFVLAGAQINGVDGCDESPLLYMIELRPKLKSRREYYANYFSVVEYLLKNGANANYKSRDGRKPLHQAVLHNLPKVCQLLVSFGADVDDTYKIGEYWQKSPLVMAFHFKRYNIIKYLFNKSAKFNVEQAENFLYIADKAVQKQDIEMLQFLIRCENSPLDREWICKKIRNTILKDRTHKKLQFLLSLSSIHPTFGETNSGLTDVCRNNIRKNLGRVQTFGKINKLKIPKTVKRYLACDSLLRHICKGTLINKNLPMKARKNAEQLLWHLNCLY